MEGGRDETHQFISSTVVINIDENGFVFYVFVLADPAAALLPDGDDPRDAEDGLAAAAGLVKINLRRIRQRW